MVGKVFTVVIAIFLLLGAFGAEILNGIKTWRTDGLATQSIVVATAVGVTTANITLAKDLYQANITNVDSITSTEGTDAAAATSYDEATLALTIAGLAANTSRTLTISYYGETDQQVMRTIGPFLGVFIIGGLAVLLIWSVFEGKKRGRSWG